MESNVTEPLSSAEERMETGTQTGSDTNTVIMSPSAKADADVNLAPLDVDKDGGVQAKKLLFERMTAASDTDTIATFTESEAERLLRERSEERRVGKEC